MTSEERARLIEKLEHNAFLMSAFDAKDIAAELKRLDAMEKALREIEKDSDQESCLHGERAKQALGESK